MWRAVDRHKDNLCPFSWQDVSEKLREKKPNDMRQDYEALKEKFNKVQVKIYLHSVICSNISLIHVHRGCERNALCTYDYLLCVCVSHSFSWKGTSCTKHTRRVLRRCSIKPVWRACSWTRSWQPWQMSWRRHTLSSTLCFLPPTWTKQPLLRSQTKFRYCCIVSLQTSSPADIAILVCWYDLSCACSLYMTETCVYKYFSLVGKSRLQ